MKKIPPSVKKFPLSPTIKRKYELYEKAVQSPDDHIDWFVQIYKEIRGKYAKNLREDFCGTFQLSAAWVKRNRANTAIALDLDPEPLAYGVELHSKELNESQKSRLHIKQQNVISQTHPKADFTIACNFSYCIFRDRKTLVEYFKAVKKSLNSDGLFLLDLAGGPGMIEKLKERKSIRKNGKSIATYVWDQRSFDPITREANYSIHFKLPTGKTLEHLFTYHWRLWTIPELRDALKDAGFQHTWVYWETTHKGEGTGEFAQAEQGDNAYAWVAYIVAGSKPIEKADSKDSKRLNRSNQSTSRRK
jgi:SAM-dependent methyltransferase